MDTRIVAAEYRMAQWAQTIKTRIERGQSIKDFCRVEGISKNAYFYWQKKLREAACTEHMTKGETKAVVPGGWARVTAVPMSQATDALTVEINGCHVTVTASTDPGLLKKVCMALRTL